MPKKTKISPEELEAFQTAVAGTRRLVHKKVRLTPTSPPKKNRLPDIQGDEYNLDNVPDVPSVQGEAFISYKHASISDKILRKLRKGQYNVEAILDLHGMSVERAKSAVSQFIQSCQQSDIRVLLIIHGKGHHSREPVLKNKLNAWLRNLDVVLAFCSAAISHGSRGAVYVLLKDSTEKYA